MTIPTPFPNQPPPFEGCNLFRIDAALREAVAREAPFAEAGIDAWGTWLGSAEAYALADDANRHVPRLIGWDRRGERIDRVEFHPAWHELMRRAMAEGEHTSPWSDPRPGAQVARAAKYYLHAQVENGTQCPLTMTFAAAPVLARHAGAASPAGLSAMLPAALLARVRETDYDPREVPIASKRSALVGMGMTERQGGSDVRSNVTHAEPLADGTWSITGHKWFFSAPQCDAHLVLAQTDAGLGCFLLPHLLPDGARNAIRINRLKDKLGNRSNASAEVEFERALAWPIGEPGRGIATILEMVGYTRLDCVIGSAGIMRAAVSWAIHHARHRVAFGAKLVDQPLMRAVLADLALESEAALAIALHLARGVDDGASPAVRAASRLIAPAAKFWVCKRAMAVTGEAMEVLGGNGYIEETPLARLYREAPVNSIWEGSGNVVCLDVGRALRHEPETADALIDELRASQGSNRDYDAHVESLIPLLHDASDDPAGARRLAQAIALAVSASELIRHAPEFIAGAFCGSRLGHGSRVGLVSGVTIPSLRAKDEQRVVARALT